MNKKGRNYPITPIYVGSALSRRASEQEVRRELLRGASAARIAAPRAHGAWAEGALCRSAFAAALLPQRVLAFALLQQRSVHRRRGGATSMNS